MSTNAPEGEEVLVLLPIQKRTHRRLAWRRYRKITKLVFCEDHTAGTSAGAGRSRAIRGVASYARLSLNGQLGTFGTVRADGRSTSEVHAREPRGHPETDAPARPAPKLQREIRALRKRICASLKSTLTFDKRNLGRWSLDLSLMMPLSQHFG